MYFRSFRGNRGARRPLQSTGSHPRGDRGRGPERQRVRAAPAVTGSVEPPGEPQRRHTEERPHVQEAGHDGAGTDAQTPGPAAVEDRRRATQRLICVFFFLNVFR